MRTWKFVDTDWEKRRKVDKIIVMPSIEMSISIKKILLSEQIPIGKWDYALYWNFKTICLSQKENTFARIDACPANLRLSESTVTATKLTSGLCSTNKASLLFLFRARSAVSFLPREQIKHRNCKRDYSLKL